MSNCTILDEDQAPEKLTGFVAMQHSINHLQYDLALAAKIHRVVQPSIRTCPLVE